MSVLKLRVCAYPNPLRERGIVFLRFKPRYSKNGLAQLISQTNLRIRRLLYFNLLGAAGWWLHYRLLKNTMHGAGQFALMNRMIPLMKRAERIVSPPFGLSVIAVLQNPVENKSTTRA